MNGPASGSSRRAATWTVSAAQLAELCDYLQVRTGIVIQPHQRDGLSMTLERAVARFGYADAGEYIEHLHDCSPDSDELEFLIANVTVGESYFFRDKTQMEFLRTAWLPELMAHKQGQPGSIRIWSAGCSQGQEIYSMAIMLRERIPPGTRWNLQLHATDINVEALSAAVAGRYTSWSFRSTPEVACEHYFTRIDQQFQLRDEIRSMVNFSYLNLVEDEFPMIANGLHSMDLILCRNVFIYFDAATIEAVMKKFARCLAPGGVLMLGGADLITARIDGLELQRAGGMFYFRRCESGPIVNLQEPEPEPVIPVTCAAADDVQAAPRPVETGERAAPVVESSIEMITALVSEQRWTEVLTAAQHYIEAQGETATVLLHKASALASLGRLEEARQLSEQAAQMEPMEKHAHFLNALILVECGELDAAEEGLRKALFVDPGFLEAHYQAGLLQLRQGHPGKGLKSLENALQIAESGDPERAIHGAPDMSYQRMAEVLRKEIDIYSHTGMERAR